MSNVESKFCKIIDAYLFTELYKRQTIKSKSFNFSEHTDNIRSKLMYITKSLAARIVKDNELENVLTNVTFSGNHLSVRASFDRHRLPGCISFGYVRNLLANSNSTSVSYIGMNFVLKDINTLLYNHHSTKDKKDIKVELNEIINNIFFIQNSIADIGKFAKEVSEANLQNLRKLKYSQYFMYGDSVIRNQTYITTINKLAELRAHVDAEAIFETQIHITNQYTLASTSFDTQAYYQNLKDTIENLHTVYVLNQTPLIPVAQVVTELVPEEVDDPAVRYITVGGERVALNIRTIRQGE